MSSSCSQDGYARGSLWLVEFHINWQGRTVGKESNDDALSTFQKKNIAIGRAWYHRFIVVTKKPCVSSFSSPAGDNSVGKARVRLISHHGP
jgi:hypothetical protein